MLLLGALSGCDGAGGAADSGQDATVPARDPDGSFADVPEQDASSDAAPDVGEAPASDAAAQPPRDAAADAAPPPTPDAAPPCEPDPPHEAPPLARRNDCGTLSYGLYANRGQDRVVHRLPDFSHAGYRGGGVALPEVPVVLELAPEGGDQRGRIQSALGELAERPRGADGFRGALLLRAGEWRVGDTLYLRASGVVLRGEGQGRRGTRLVATRRAQHDLIVVEGGGRGLGEQRGTRQRIVDDYVPVGATGFTVASAEGFDVDDTVGVERTPNRRWIDDLDMARWGWTEGSYAIGHERRVVAVEGDRITVDVPLVDTMEARYGGGAVFLADLSDRVEQVGVEDLRLVSEFDGDDDEAHAWTAVRLSRARDGWVRRVTAQHFGFAAVSIEDESSFNTVEECAMLAPVSVVTGSRRYAFHVSDGTGNLFQRCYSEHGRHDFVTGSRTTGPNVWLDCFSTQSTNDAGPHHRWSTGILLDNVASRFLHVENRAQSGTGHGWSGAQVLFWNSAAEGVRCDAPTGAMSWTVGTAGAEQEGQWVPAEPPGWWASQNRPVEPRSLYLQQLRDRLGRDAVAQVTTEAQRVGRTWGQLATWAGEGRLSEFEAAGGDATCATGVASGTTCCHAGCGACGGDGCGARPGGGANCCSGVIRGLGRSCAVTEPPCLMDPAFDPL